MSGYEAWVRRVEQRLVEFDRRIRSAGTFSSGSLVLPDTDWIYVGSGGSAPAFSGTWVNYDNDHIHARFRRRSGWVKVEGLVKNGTAGTVIFTLPAGFRMGGMPANSGAKTLYPAVSDAGLARVDVTPSGVVTHASGTGTAFCSLSAIAFPAEQ